MISEARIADVLSRIKCCSDDLADARTKQQKTMRGIDAKVALDEGFQLINELLVESEALRKDAERYQSLRLGMGWAVVVQPDNAASCDCDRYDVLLEGEVDEAVDADIAKAVTHD